MHIFVGCVLKIGSEWQVDKERLKETGGNAEEMALHDKQSVIFHRLKREENSIHWSKCSEPWKWQHLARCPFVHGEAAERNNVPSTTLYNRVSGRVVHNVNPGPVRYLNPVEENTLATFLKHCSEVGNGKTRKEVLAIAEGVARDKNILRGTKISQGWWRNFIERQRDLSLRRGDNTAHSRMDAVNAETMQHYFNLLKDVLDKNGLMNAPHQIYNVDESGVPLDPKALNVVAKKGSKKVRVRSTGRKGQVTVVACGNTAGQVIPPMIIFDAKSCVMHGQEVKSQEQVMD